MGTKKPKLEWKPLVGMNGWRLNRSTAYWKGQRGWWAQRAGSEGIHGPFKKDEARRWAEEPVLAELARTAERREEKAREAESTKAAKREAKAVKTWGTLPPEARVVSPGQIWAMRASGYATYEVLVTAVHKEAVSCVVRKGNEPWQECPKDARSLHALLRLYHFQGVAPADQMKKVIAKREA